ncbi:hypothetical protein GCM10010492_55950 [Saccharothrix mutabilis subsp. mutabilis]|uniref:CHAT domain-containing protein n=1 Tax=Saccharothrix mutabilis subsp. mutabilis TaxID=66855 RepID=A0ABN0UFI0_9PSEU
MPLRDPDALRDEAIGLLSSYPLTGRRDLVEQAVALFREVVAGRRRAGDLNNLVAALGMLSEHDGDPEVLREAVRAGREAVASAGGDRARARYLDNLGGVLRGLFARTGEPHLLDEAVRAGRDAVALTPTGDRQRVAFLSNLGASLQARYDRTAQLDVLREAARVGREAVAACPPDDQHRAVYLHNLCGTLEHLHHRGRDLDVLREAVRVAREAVAAAHPDHPGRAAMLGSMAGVLALWSERVGDAGALREAVRVTRSAVAATPPGRPDRAMHLNNLGSMLLATFRLRGDVDALREAVRAGREAVAASPPDDPDRSLFLDNLGAALRELSSPEAVDEARRCHRAAAESTTGKTTVRIRAHRRLASLADTPGEALRAVEAAIDLVEALTSDGRARADRQHDLGRLGRLADEAAAAALAAGRPERAVELLERTRGILAADAVGMRGADYDRLRDRRPDLADRLDELRARLDDLDRAPSDRNPRLADERRATHLARQRLVEQIRALPGFAGFFRAPRVEHLAAHARDRPVVFVTAGRALVLAEGRPVGVVPLPGLTPAAAGEQTDRLLTACRAAGVREVAPAAGRSAQHEVRDVLSWLGDAVVDPVLTHLGHTATPQGTWPTVCWCPVGAMAFLPLHAAGSALDRVVSSYTTTVRALSHTNHRRTGTGTLVVPVPEEALPGIGREAEAIRRLVPDARLLRTPTRDAVLEALPGHHIAHFACHGHADRADPSRSRLVLADHATNPLTVTEVAALRLSADLAYLSACDTSVTAPELADESVHITGAFHLAGYRHVVGTLWPIDDTTAAELATEFYTRLTDGGTAPPEPARSASALHEATRTLRARHPGTPTAWAAYTHTGP